MCEQGQDGIRPAQWKLHSPHFIPAIFIDAYFLLEMRLLQIVDLSELKLKNKSLKKKTISGLHKTFYSLSTHSPVVILLSDFLLPVNACETQAPDLCPESAELRCHHFAWVSPV